MTRLMIPFVCLLTSAPFLFGAQDAVATGGKLVTTEQTPMQNQAQLQQEEKKEDHSLLRKMLKRMNHTNPSIA